MTLVLLFFIRQDLQDDQDFFVCILNFRPPARWDEIENTKSLREKESGAVMGHPKLYF